MQKRCIGNTDLAVSMLGLGTVKFGRTQGVKYPQPFQLPSDQDIQNLLSVARELGINLIDTAPAYGVSEERLGHALKNNRHDWIISTKAGEEFADDVSHYDFSSAAITKSVERSLKRLHTDYLDILLIHSNGDDERIIEEDQVFTTLAQLKQSGKIRAYGMSSKTIGGGLLTIQHADIAMITFNPIQTEERVVIEAAAKNQKNIFIKKAFASGHLQKIAAKNPVTESLRFIFNEPGVTSVIVGTINPVHLRENAVPLP